MTHINKLVKTPDHTGRHTGGHVWLI